MEKISQLMDGELGEREARLQVRRLGSDARLVQAWDTYHLIRDALRDDICVGADFERRLRQRLDEEPTVLAPHAHFASRVGRYSLPLAATLAGVALVGWLALSSQPQTPQIAATKPESRAVPALATPSGQMNDYLLAHQEFSPYVRTVSNEDRDPAR